MGNNITRRMSEICKALNVREKYIESLRNIEIRRERNKLPDKKSLKVKEIKEDLFLNKSGRIFLKTEWLASHFNGIFLENGLLELYS